MAAFFDEFAYVDLLFFDPDNGLEVKGLPIGRKTSSKFLYLDEVQRHFESGKSILIYQHFARVERSAFIATCGARLRAAVPVAAIWAFRTKDVVFLLLIHPLASEALREAAAAAAVRWDTSFIAGQSLDLEEPPATAEVLSEETVKAAAAEIDHSAALFDPEPTPVSSPRPSLVSRILALLR